jgi:hypothetical protein
MHIEIGPNCGQYSSMLCIVGYQKYLKALFGSWNRPPKWNDYFYGIVIFLFDRGLFLAIVIPMGITIPFRKRILISLKKMRE